MTTQRRTRVFQSALRFAVVSDGHVKATGGPLGEKFQSALRFAVVSDYRSRRDSDRYLEVSIRFKVRGGFRQEKELP